MNARHRTRDARRTRREDGIALITVLIFTFVLTIAGAAFFTLSYYENRQATYRQESAEAFYLADGAVERARAQLFEDKTWRAAVYDDTLGRGTYDLVVQDSTYLGAFAVHVLGVGNVGRAERRVEVFANVRPPFPPVLVLGDLDAGGNFCLEGVAHANGDADFGNNDVHFQSGGCDKEGSYDEGYVILPPVVYTEPGYYPGSTYYFVTVVPASPPEARIWKYVAGDTLEITDSLLAMGVDLSNDLTGGGGSFEFEFKKPEVAQYFDAAGNVFRMDAGDSAIVVNFCAWPGVPLVDVHFQGDETTPIPATIINARFTGATVPDRWDYRFWTGGDLEADNKTTFAPLNGFTLIAYDFFPSGSQVRAGTPAFPGLTYVCRDVERFNGGLEVNGAIIVLRNWESNGGVDIHFYPEFIARLPGYLKETYAPGTGIADFLVWREVAAGS